MFDYFTLPVTSEIAEETEMGETHKVEDATDWSTWLLQNCQRKSFPIQGG